MDNPFDIDISLNKKKKKKELLEPEVIVTTSDYPEEPDYSYNWLLKRIPTVPEDVDTSLVNKLFLSQPQLVKHNRRIVVLNFETILTQLKRDYHHILHFIHTETGMHCSIDQDTKRLNIKGRINQQNFETIIRKYVAKYIICKVCRNYDTQFIKIDRLILIKCNHCKSQVSTSEERKVYN